MLFHGSVCEVSFTPQVAQGVPRQGERQREGEGVLLGRPRRQRRRLRLHRRPARLGGARRRRQRPPARRRHEARPRRRRILAADAPGTDADADGLGAAKIHSSSVSQSKQATSPNVKIVNYSNLALGMGNF